MVAVSSDLGVCALEFIEAAKISSKLNGYQRLFNQPVVEHIHSHLKSLAKELTEYFAGERTSFETPLHLVGTEFDKGVWNALLHIPYGRTISYGRQAMQMGTPKAVRAIASANGRNRIAILVPCHRVVGANGKLTGYAAGLWRKQKLLELEGAVAPLLF